MRALFSCSCPIYCCKEQSCGSHARCLPHRKGKERPLNVLDIEQTVANSIRHAGGTQSDMDIWEKTWDDLTRCCDVKPGVSDDYTKDLVLCWSGWVLLADPEATDRIYSSCRGFNLSLKDDESGREASDKLFASIDKHVSDPASVYRELARDQIERMRRERSAIPSA